MLSYTINKIILLIYYSLQYTQKVVDSQPKQTANDSFVS